MAVGVSDSGRESAALGRILGRKIEVGVELSFNIWCLNEWVEQRTGKEMCLLAILSHCEITIPF